jgi:hypothetical protein
MRSGKLVQIGLITHGKNRGSVSTHKQPSRFVWQPGGVQPRFIPQLFPFFTQHFSPLRIASSPLIEHYFYPVSTEPITIPTKGKLKKGNT